LGDLVAKAQQGARGETGARELLERETEMRNLSKKAKTIIAGAAVIGLATSGVAYAYWSTTGSGAGSASTNAGVINVVEFSQTAAQIDLQLYPGQAAQTIAGTVTNPSTNPQSVYVNTVDATISGVTPTAAGILLGGCDDTNYVIAGARMSVATDLATGDSKAFSGQTIQFVNKVTPQDGCKNATVHLTFTSN
jgi:hypothetical protein